MIPPPPRAALALLLTSFISTRAMGAESAARTALGWTRQPGAEACIGAKDLALAVERRLGRAALVSAAQAELYIDGRVEPGPVGFRAHLTFSNARSETLGTRDLEDPDPTCRALDEQLALVVALLVDPDAVLGPPPAPPPRPPPPPPPPPAVSASAPPPRSPPVREPWRASLSLGPSALIGLLPKVTGGGSLLGEIVPPSFVPIEIGAAAWLSVSVGAPAGTSGGAAVSISYATIGLCPLVYRTARTSVRGCADLAVGAIRSVGQGFTATNTGDEVPFAEAMLAGRASFRIVGPLQLGVGLALAVPLTRPEFVYLDATKNQQEIFRLGPVAGTLDATIGLTFP